MDQVIFDGDLKTITCLDNVEKLNIKQVYSQWKRWVVDLDNGRYLPAFSVVGGESIIEEEIIEPYFFLTNGWKIKPREEDHTLIIDGLLFTLDGQQPIAPTDGGYTVTIYSMIPTMSASTIEYAEIQRVAIEDMLNQFFETVLQYNDLQKQSIRDALTLNPTSGLMPNLYSIDTIIDRIDINTQRFNQENDFVVTVDTTSLEDKINLMSNKIEDIKNISTNINDISILTDNKVDILLNKSDGEMNVLNTLNNANLDIDILLQRIEQKIDSL